MDISEKMGVQEAIIVSVLKDPIAKVKEMFANTAGKAVLRPKLVVDADGQRVYNEMWTADKWLTDQVGRGLHEQKLSKFEGPRYSPSFVGNLGAPGTNHICNDLVRQNDFRQSWPTDWPPSNYFTR